MIIRESRPAFHFYLFLRLFSGQKHINDNHPILIHNHQLLLLLFAISNYDCTNSIGLLVELSDLVKVHYLHVCMCLCVCLCVFMRKCACMLAWMCSVCVLQVCIQSSLSTEMQQLEQNCGVMRQNRENIAAEKTRVFTVGQCRYARDVCNLVCCGSFGAKTTTYTIAIRRLGVFSRIQQ